MAGGPGVVGCVLALLGRALGVAAGIESAARESYMVECDAPAASTPPTVDTHRKPTSVSRSLVNQDARTSMSEPLLSHPAPRAM